MLELTKQNFVLVGKLPSNINATTIDKLFQTEERLHDYMNKYLNQQSKKVGVGLRNLTE